ncbi:hypothetical protein [Sedimenticola hydrogenitrophicus]|uniref:hypothetical protein n=1 Tax=Sedimenticola hydrogenitrophicus TaxID=2967975 RepID=UPI0023B063C3|nr:hypothetical protein [Sedimenticola hydrogenitrophicus]
MHPELIIGAEGWEHAAWNESFYPDDLPPEWRLSYYANEFSLLLVPFEVWRTGDDERFRGWREDVAGGFRFVLDVTGMALEDGRSLQQLQRCQSALGDRLAGGVSWSAASPSDCARLRGWLGDGRFLASAARRPDLPLTVRVAADGTTLCALIPSEAAADLKWLRSVLESLSAGRAETKRLLLFFTGTPPRTQTMQEAGLLWQLLAGMRR